MTQIQNVFFDLDGTLMDPLKGFAGCIRHALQTLGQACPTDNELRAFVGPPLRDTFSKLLNTNESSTVEKAVTIYRERYSPVGIFENEVYPGVVKLLTDLHEESYKLYVVTTKPKIYADIIVRHFSLIQWFTDIFGTGMDGGFDNKAELITFIIGNLKLAPDQTVMIGDRKDDISAGKTNRIRTIGVTYGYGTSEEITTAAPDHVCNNPSEIAALLESLRIPRSGRSS